MSAPEPSTEIEPAPDRAVDGWWDAVRRQAPVLRPRGRAAWVVEVAAYAGLPALAVLVLLGGTEATPAGIGGPTGLGAGLLVVVAVLALAHAAGSVHDPRGGRLAATPLAPNDHARAAVVLTLARASAAVVVVVGCLVALGALDVVRIPVTLVAAALALDAHVGLLVAAAASFSARANAVVGRTLVAAAVLFSGAFFALSQLSGVVDAVTWLLPTRHAVEVAHAAASGPLDATIVGHVVVLLAFGFLGALLAHRALRRTGAR